MKKDKCCWTCKYHYRFGEEYDSECDNEKSQYFQCPVFFEDVCNEYEEAEWIKKEKDERK